MEICPGIPCTQEPLLRAEGELVAEIDCSLELVPMTDAVAAFYP